MAYNQDGKYQHWLKISPSNIQEKNTNYAECSDAPTPADWKMIEKEQRGENESMYHPWESEGQVEKDRETNRGMLERQTETHSGEGARKPYSGEEAGRTRNPNMHGGGRRGATRGE
jgi:hypothetical protein